MSENDKINDTNNKKQKGGNDYSDIALSTRVRLARNIKKYPFISMMSDTDRIGVLNDVKAAVLDNRPESVKNFNYLNVQTMTETDKLAMVEKHLISPEFAQSTHMAGVILNNEETISIMVNEEDHMRIQSIVKGFNIDEAFSVCDKLDNLIEEKLEYAFSNTYGYLTGCPSNVGSGMRVSVMLHLPALVKSKRISPILESAVKLGITARGIYGEKSDALGNIFQISNGISLGISEIEIINLVKSVSVQIIERERKLREILYNRNPEEFENTVFRSFGIFSNARLMSFEEALILMSNVRMGSDMGIIDFITKGQLDSIMEEIQISNIMKKIGSESSQKQRDCERARIIRNALKEEK